MKDIKTLATHHHVTDCTSKSEAIELAKDPENQGKTILVTGGEFLPPFSDPYIFKDYHKHLEDLYPFMGEATIKQQIDASRTVPVQPKELINRNDDCTCGSGKKYKKCCLRKNH